MFDDWKASQERPYETRIPQEAEYSYYSTGTARPHAPKRTGLIVLLTLLVILACAILSLLISLKIQLNGRDIQTALSASNTEQEPAEPTQPEPEADIAIPAPTQVEASGAADLQIAKTPD